MKIRKRAFKVNYLILFVLFLTTGINAQKVEKFFDFKWKECKSNEAQYYAVTVKIDSTYLRRNYFIKQQKLLYSMKCKDSICKMKDGEFFSLYVNGNIESKGIYKNNKKDGAWLSFHNNGKMKDSIFFSNGNPFGIRLSWHPNGFKRDSIYESTAKSGARVSWFDNGVPSYYGSYVEGNKKTGKWKYFHKNGKISAIETYENLNLAEVKYFNENGVVLNINEVKNTPAINSIDEKNWNRNLAKSILSNFPDGFKLINTDKVTVVADFTVNEEGNVENVYLSVPFDDHINDIIIKTIKKTGKWIPATDHNRKVKQEKKIPISFTENQF